MKTIDDATHIIQRYNRLAHAKQMLAVLAAVQTSDTFTVNIGGTAVLDCAPSGYIASVIIRTALVDFWTDRRDAAAEELKQLGFE